jgi:hypothetical protein
MATISREDVYILSQIGLGITVASAIFWYTGFPTPPAGTLIPPITEEEHKVLTAPKQSSTGLPTKGELILASLTSPSQELPKDDCIICRDTHTDPVQLACKHVYCRACIHSWFAAQHGWCPYCHRYLFRAGSKARHAVSALVIRYNKWLLWKARVLVGEVNICVAVSLIVLRCMSKLVCTRGDFAVLAMLIGFIALCLPLHGQFGGARHKYGAYWWVCFRGRSRRRFWLEFSAAIILLVANVVIARNSMGAWQLCVQAWLDWKGQRIMQMFLMGGIALECFRWRRMMVSMR